MASQEATEFYASAAGSAAWQPAIALERKATMADMPISVFGNIDSVHAYLHLSAALPPGVVRRRRQYEVARETMTTFDQRLPL